MIILQPSGLFLLSDVKRHINASLIVDQSLNYVHIIRNISHYITNYIILCIFGQTQGFF